MRYGVIDIGSNTIRGVAYNTDGRRAEKIADKLVRSHILTETYNNVLSENGITRLVAVLNKLGHVLRELECDKIRYFATSAIRELDNAQEVKNAVLEAAGIEIDILDRECEAQCDFAALRANIPEHSAIGLDLGGGSCQIVQFEADRLLFSASYPIGANRMKQRFVADRLPVHEERKKISFCVRNEIIEIDNLFGSRYLYAMGGTAKAALKLHYTLDNNHSRDGFVSCENMDKLCRLCEKEPDMMYEMLARLVKNNAETVIPGIIVLRELCYLLDADGFYALECSVRDGYLMNMLKNGDKV